MYNPQGVLPDLEQQVFPYNKCSCHLIRSSDCHGSIMYNPQVILADLSRAASVPITNAVIKAAIVMEA